MATHSKPIELSDASGDYETTSRRRVERGSTHSSAPPSARLVRAAAPA